MVMASLEVQQGARRGHPTLDSMVACSSAVAVVGVLVNTATTICSPSLWGTLSVSLGRLCSRGIDNCRPGLSLDCYLGYLGEIFG